MNMISGIGQLMKVWSMALLTMKSLLVVTRGCKAPTDTAFLDVRIRTVDVCLFTSP